MDPERARELLAAERERIERELDALADDDQDDAGYDEAQLDQGDAAYELYEDERDETRAEDLRDQLAAVERAEERLAAGTYGLSIASGDPIPDERLEAVPTAELTVDEERARRG